MKSLGWSLLLGLLPTTLCQTFNYGTTFPKNKLYGLKSDSIGLDKIEGTIAAFGDFNGDKFTDLFVLASDQTSVTVYLWNHLPGDYNYDGHLDVLLMGEENPEKPDEIKMQIYLGNGNDTFEPEAIKLPSAKGALPIVLDINGDMKTDILGYSKETSELSTWINVGDMASLFNVSSAESLFDKESIDECNWATPHSNAFVDLDGDCLADLVFVCSESGSAKSIQIYTNSRQNGFKLSQKANLPTGAGPLSFADMDGDGSIDIIFPVCQEKDCSIHVVYNQQMGLCSKDDEESCRKATKLCTADPNFKFDFTMQNSKNHIVYDIKDNLNSEETILMMDDNFRGNLPISVHTGDYNMDGYPDLLVTTNKRVVLLQSILCTEELCTSEAVQAEKRSFSLVTTGVEALESVPKPRQAAFFDIDEDGSLDMVVLQSTSLSDAGRVPNFIINNYFNDAFFLKGLVSNGVSSHRGYGVSYPGASLKFTVLDTSGIKRSHQISQLSQSAYLSLLTPYCLFGLGRTNNYVEEMFAGVTRHQEKNYYLYEGVIPNSQLVILPYQPEDVQDSTSWKVELYIKPGDHVPWVLGVLMTAAIILGIVVVVLRVMEKREDEMERQKALHIINFDAL
ncbi:hypothetical protein G6F56_006860 [Rhizopus delemar]|nr:hypothetical protein G6F56_006860 [Rhizopus delemar]